MNHVQITINIEDEELQNVVIALLSDIDYDGFEISETVLQAFVSEVKFDENSLQEILQPYNLTYQLQTIEKQNWNELWESNFTPVIIDNFVGVRAHFHEPITNCEHEIIITPKMSFGTGHHATTFSVMQLMREIDFKEKTVFDFGTGTGILAILAEKLGAQKILAVDNDDWCIENGLENILANACEKITILKSDSAKTNEKYNVVIANINKHIILENQNFIAESVTQRGKLILSGLLKEDEKEILEVFLSKEFSYLKTKEKSSWIAILLEKN